MTNKQIAKILDLHSANYYIENGRIFADVPYAHSLLWDHVEDLTGYTRSQLLEWLGY